MRLILEFNPQPVGQVPGGDREIETMIDEVISIISLLDALKLSLKLGKHVAPTRDVERLQRAG